MIELIIKIGIILGGIGLASLLISYLIYTAVKLFLKVISNKNRKITFISNLFQSYNDKWVQLLFFISSTIFFIIFLLGFIGAIVYHIIPPHNTITIY